MNLKKLNEKSEVERNKICSLKDMEAAFGYIPIIEVEEYNQLVPYTDNLETMGTDYSGHIISRGIVHVKDGNFLDIKCEYDDEIKTEIISARKAAELIVQYQKFELFNEFYLEEEARAIASGF